MANISVTVEDANNIILELTPVPTQTITIDRGVAGVGIESITIVTIDGDQYLQILFTNGTTSDVGPVSATSYTGVTPIVVNNTTNQISLDVVPLTLGGTNATTAAGARTNLGLGSAATLTAGAANGVATLDSGGTVPLSQIPASIQGGVSYQGAWNATTNTPTLVSGVGTKGYYYVVSTAGSTDLDGITTWNIGDWAIFNGSIWQKIDNTDAVTSVNGLTGTVVITAADLDALTEITSSDASIDVSQMGTSVNLQVSQNSPASTLLAQVRNQTGATLAKGTIVYISGASGNKCLVSKAQANSESNSSTTFGMVTADITNNSNGYVTISGIVSGLDTSAFPDGTTLYLSPTVAGGYTSTKPYAPDNLVYIGTVTYSHANQGAIQTRIQNGYELDELHNVSAQSPTTGQTIVYNSATSLWEKSFAPVISGTTINNTTIGATTASTGAFTTMTASADSSFTSTGAVQLSKGTTAERPTGAAGKLRFNTTTSEFEGYNGSTWASVGGAAISNDTSTSTAVYPLFASATSGTASTVYTSNSNYLYTPSTGELKAKEMVSSNGVVVNADSVSSNYTIAAGTNGFSVGPLTVNSGVTLTVASGQRHIVI